GVVRDRHSHGHLRRDLAVEARLRDPEAHLIDERALLRVERRELHEHRLRTGRPVGVLDADPRATGGPRVLVEHGHRANLTAERAAHPTGGDIGDVDGDHGPTSAFRAREQAPRAAHPTRWSFTTPTACIAAYAVVGPTKRKP